MNNSYFAEIKARIIQDAIQTNHYAAQNDIKRNRVNYGGLTALLGVVEDMGHKVDHAVWEDNECLKIPYVKIGEEKIEFQDGN